MTKIQHTNPSDRERFISEAISTAVQPLIDQLVQESVSHLEDELTMEREAKAAAMQQLLACQNAIESKDATIIDLNNQISSLRQDLREREVRHRDVLDSYTSFKGRLETLVRSIPDVQPALIEGPSTPTSPKFLDSPTFGSEPAIKTSLLGVEPNAQDPEIPPHSLTGVESISSSNLDAVQERTLLDQQPFPCTVVSVDTLKFDTFCEIESRHAQAEWLDDLTYLAIRRTIELSSSGSIIPSGKNKGASPALFVKDGKVSNVSYGGYSLSNGDLVRDYLVVCPRGRAAYKIFLLAHIQEDGRHLSVSQTQEYMEEFSCDVLPELVAELVETCPCSSSSLHVPPIEPLPVSKKSFRPDIYVLATDFSKVWGSNLDSLRPSFKARYVFVPTVAPFSLNIEILTGELTLTTTTNSDELDEPEEKAVQNLVGPSSAGVQKGMIFEVYVKSKVTGLSMTKC
ncbi:hypothetical protein DL96DRAFT_668762 [Flagelloscypha sp. PMI_526]|nr:hypothetical protein DL96DRAFT_668762 [Flagelloscypha sp. PMI_526]